MGLVSWSGALPRWPGWLAIGFGLLLLLAWEEIISRTPLQQERPQLVWVPTFSIPNQLVAGPFLVWLLLPAGWLMTKDTVRTSHGKPSQNGEITNV